MMIFIKFDLPTFKFQMEQIGKLCRVSIDIVYCGKHFGTNN